MSTARDSQPPPPSAVAASPAAGGFSSGSPPVASLAAPAPGLAAAAASASASLAALTLARCFFPRRWLALRGRPPPLEFRAGRGIDSARQGVSRGDRGVILEAHMSCGLTNETLHTSHLLAAPPASLANLKEQRRCSQR